MRDTEGRQLYGTPEERAAALSIYSDEQLEFLIGFPEGSVAYQEERMRRLEELKAREAEGIASGGTETT